VRNVAERDREGEQRMLDRLPADGPDDFTVLGTETGGNLVKTIVDRFVGRFGEVVLERSDFDVVFRSGDGPWRVSRQSAWVVVGVGESRLGFPEDEARRRFESSRSIFAKGRSGA
jgi:hypothetical protein